MLVESNLGMGSASIVVGGLPLGIKVVGGRPFGILSAFGLFIIEIFFSGVLIGDVGDSLMRSNGLARLRGDAGVSGVDREGPGDTGVFLIGVPMTGSLITGSLALVYPFAT